MTTIDIELNATDRRIIGAIVDVMMEARTPPSGPIAVAVDIITKSAMEAVARLQEAEP